MNPITSLSPSASEAIGAFFQNRHLSISTDRNNAPALYRDAFGEVWMPNSIVGHVTQLRRLGLRTHVARLRQAARRMNCGLSAFVPVIYVEGRAPSRLVIIPRAAGAVILDESDGSVWKILPKRPALVDNEAQALSHLEQVGAQDYAPRKLGAGRLAPTGYAYLKTVYHSSARHIPRAERKVVLKKTITPLLFSIYERVGIDQVSADAYLADLEIGYRKVFEREQNDWLIVLARKLLERADHGFVYLTRIHGDVGLGNALTVGNKVVLIDWAMSDHGNVFRDLFRQEHRNFDITTLFWSNLLNDQVISDDLAGGWAGEFCVHVHHRLGWRPSSRDLAFQFVAALIERIIFDFRVYGRGAMSRGSYTLKLYSYLFDIYGRALD